jgi:hypothetical protein
VVAGAVDRLALNVFDVCVPYVIQRSMPVRARPVAVQM